MRTKNTNTALQHNICACQLPVHVIDTALDKTGVQDPQPIKKAGLQARMSSAGACVWQHETCIPESAEVRLGSVDKYTQSLSRAVVYAWVVFGIPRAAWRYAGQCIKSLAVYCTYMLPAGYTNKAKSTKAW